MTYNQTNIQSFNFSLDILAALLWQYNSADNLINLVNFKNEWYMTNQTQFWNDWFHNIFNVLNVPPSELDPLIHSFGLEVWSLILNLPLEIGDNVEPDDALIFGMRDPGSLYPLNSPGNQNFDHGNFKNIGPLPEYPIQWQQLLLRIRYVQLTTRGDVLSINYALSFLFSDYAAYGVIGPVYVLDGLDMSMAYVFVGSLNPQLKAAFLMYDILPRPSGVLLKIYSNIHAIWGVTDDGNIWNQNFEHGCFIGD